MREPRHNVLVVLRDVAARVPDRAALIMEDDAITFAGLWERVDRVGAGLRRLGLGQGDRAIVMIPMSIDLYAVLLGLLEIGAVAVFVDPWIGRRQIAAFAAFAEPRAYLGIPKSHLLRLADRRLRSIPISVTTGGRLGPLPARHTLAELETEPGDGEVSAVEPDDPALITFTSGSSGEPKGANRTHGFLLAQHRALAAEFPAEEGVDMPMFPVFALNNLASGVTSVVPAMDFRRVETVDAARVLRQMRAHGVTTCTASPPFFDRIAEHLAARPEDRPPLRRLLTGGAPVSDGQLRTWRQALPDPELLVVYGSTEAEPVAHLTAEERLAAVNDIRPRTPGYCVGRPCNSVRTKVIRIQAGPVELADELAPGEIGELVVSGDHVCRDYYRNPGAVRENKIIDSDGTVWHRMGDTGSFDTAGRFWIAGRVHSTIHRASGLLHPQLVEQAARGEDERIRRIAAVGVDDRAVVVVETDAGEEMKREVAARLVEAWIEVDEIVLTREPLPVDPRHNSKIDYGRVGELLGLGEARAFGPSPNPKKAAAIRAYLAERFPLVGHGVLICAYYSSNQFLARVLTEPGRPMRYDGSSLLGALTLFLFFFHLRVFDEHKDYEEDCRHYPQRALQRGLVTLRDLKVLGGIAIGLEVVLCALRGRAALASWAVAFAFSLLMLEEFFVPGWLKRHFLVYAVSHLLVMPFLSLMVFAFATGRWPWEAPPWFWMYAWVGFFVTFNWEVSRKIRAPADEIDGVETYTRIFGTYGAAYLVLLIRVIDTGLVALVGWHLGLSPWFYGALVALFLVCLVGFFQYRLHTNRKTAKRMETYAGMYIIAFDVILAIEIARRFGLEL